MLRYFEELSLDEIVEVTGWRLGTVKSRIHRALCTARTQLERLGYSMTVFNVEKEVN